MARQIRKAQSADVADRHYYFWRLLTKERLFIRNKDQLMTVPEGDRVEKLDATLGAVEEEYATRLTELDRRIGVGLGKVVAEFCGPPAATGSKRKRKVIDDDEDDNEGEASERGKKVAR